MATPSDYEIQAKPYSNPERSKREARGESRGVILHQEQKAELKATAERKQSEPVQHSVRQVKDGDTVENESGGRQSFVAARMDLIPPTNQLLLGECLGFGADKYGEDNWKLISKTENLNHAIVHILKELSGDRSEPHLVNTLARVNFALWHAINEGDQPATYIHPDMLNHDTDQA